VSEREAQLVTAYRERRLLHQRRYYDDRREEYQRASGQLALLTAALVALGGVAGVLSSANAYDAREAWAILAAAGPALATFLIAYDALFGFERNAKLFTDASSALRLAELRAPAQSADADAVRMWIEQVEGILQREQGQWGQLAADAESRSSQRSGRGHTLRRSCRCRPSGSVDARGVPGLHEQARSARSRRA
jgi:SMODS and SLOG-associating 2TM effector domain 1